MHVISFELFLLSSTVAGAAPRQFFWVETPTGTSGPAHRGARAPLLAPDRGLVHLDLPVSRSLPEHTSTERSRCHIAHRLGGTISSERCGPRTEKRSPLGCVHAAGVNLDRERRARTIENHARHHRCSVVAGRDLIRPLRAPAPHVKEALRRAKPCEVVLNGPKPRPELTDGAR